MQETMARDGHARIASWSPAEGLKATTPGLIWPETSVIASPPDLAAYLVAEPTQAKRIELVSLGTHFHPHESSAPLVIPTVIPAPSTKPQVVTVGDVAILHDGAAWASNPRNLIDAFIAAKMEAEGKLFWMPGLGAPDDYALWAYLGVDLFDAMTLVQAAFEGKILTTDGPLAAKDAAALGHASQTVEERIQTNLALARKELAFVSHHIQQGTLRSLVERRVYVKPASVEILRRFDREAGFLESGTPHHRAVPLPCMTAESLSMPEVVAFRSRFQDHYVVPDAARVLLLLPCSQGKPYKLSRSHRTIARALEDTGVRSSLHEVMITSPLGLVPRELEEIYPAGHYDVPVTGHWLGDEVEIIRTQVASLMDKGAYDAVIVHAGQESLDIMRDLLPDTTLHTCLSHATSFDDLARLRKAIAGLNIPRVDWAERKLSDMKSVLSFQFNATVATEMTRGAQATGRSPYIKLERGGVQIGTTTPDRGVVSLTLEGAKILAEHKMNRIHIGDFTPKKTSTLFAVGVVGADPGIRVGDEVAVVKPDGTVVACGTANMSSFEMTHAKRGSAASLRHLGGGA